MCKCCGGAGLRRISRHVFCFLDFSRHLCYYIWHARHNPSCYCAGGNSVARALGAAGRGPDGLLNLHLQPDRRSIRVCLRVYACRCLCICIYTHICRYVDIDTYTYAYAYTHVDVFSYVRSMYECVCVYGCVCVYMRVCVCMHM